MCIFKILGENTVSSLSRRSSEEGTDVQSKDEYCISDRRWLSPFPVEADCLFNTSEAGAFAIELEQDSKIVNNLFLGDTDNKQ